MATDLLERLEQPEYTGENRCVPCTAVNLLLVAVAAALAGRRNRALGALTLLAGAAAVWLRGYLVPGTPELTERYLPQSVLSAFGKADRPADLDASLTRRAADRAGDEGVPVEVTDPGTAGEETEADGTDATDDADEDGDGDADVTREAVEALLERPMDEVLEAFAVVEDGEDDLVLVEGFRDAWTGRIEALSDDGAERRAAFADVLGVPVADVALEQREDGRYYGLLDGDAVHNWITEAALLSDLAAQRALEDSRWALLEPAERLSVLRGVRVFLTTCPECGGPVSATDDVVESCCGAWDVVAVECGDCGARVLELEAPAESAASGPDAADPADPGAGGFTR